MTLIKKTSLFILLGMLSLLILLLVKTYHNAEPVAEYLVSVFSDYELKIDGDLAVKYTDGWLNFSLLNSRLLRKNNNSTGEANSDELRKQDSLLAAERIQAQVRLVDLLQANLVLGSVSASGLHIFIERNQLSDMPNWQVSTAKQSTGSDNNGRRDWQWHLGTINISDTVVIISGYDQQQKILFESMELTGFDTNREFSVAGSWNNYPLSAEGQLRHGVEFLKAKPYADKNFHVDAKASLAGVQLNVSGAVTDQTSDMDMTLTTNDFSLLSSVVGFELPDLGIINFTSHLKTSSSGVHFTDSLLLISGKDLSLKVKGDINRLVDDYQADITWSINADDLGRLDIRNNYPLLAGLQVASSGAVTYAGNQADFNSPDLNMSNSHHQYSLQLKKATVEHRDWRQFDISLNNGLLDYIFNDDEDAESNAVSVTGDRRWRYQYPLEQITLSLGPEKPIEFSTQGSYKKMAVLLQGQWLDDDRYQLAGMVDEASVNVSGYLKEQHFNVVGKVDTPNLSLLSKLLNQPLIAVNSAEVIIDVLVADNKATINKLDLLLRKEHSQIAVKGSIDNLFSIEDYRFDVTASSASVVNLEQWLSENDRAIETTVSAFTNSCSLASEGDKDYCRQLVVPMQWLSDTTDLLAIKHWLDFTEGADGRLLASFTIGESSSKLFVLMPEVNLISEQLTVDWQGELIEQENGLSLQGEVSAKLAQGTLEAVKTDVSLTAKLNQSEAGPLQLTQLVVDAGETQLAADLALTISDGALNSVSGQLNFQQLDLRPYVNKKSLTTEQPESSTFATSAPAVSIIPERTFDLDWLPSSVLMLDLSIEKLMAPGFQLDKVTANIKHSQQRFEINPFAAVVSDGPLRGRLMLDDTGAHPQVAIYLEGRQLPAGESQLFEDVKLVKSGKVDVLVSLSSAGSNLKELLAKSNGRISLVTHDATMNGPGLDEIAPGIITEINQRINPFSRKKQQDTKVECGLVHFDIDQGLMTADQSIVLVTPNISFGAHGVIDFNKERLRLQLVPRTRKGLGLSFKGGFAKMAVISGSLHDPKVEFDPAGAITSSSIDVAGTVLYGPVYWLYLGQAQKILASSKACERAIDAHAPEFNKPVDRNIFFDNVLPDQWRAPIENWLPF